jgi:ATP-dependent helicase Lhr and Lhr-like helicase
LKTHPKLQAWLNEKQWKAFAFQRQVWQSIGQGDSGLLHATTGSGKTYAVWLGLINRVLHQRSKKNAEPETPKLRVIWLTPMRALASDTLQALQEPISSLLPHWQVAIRTGDTSSGERAKQNRKPPHALVTTPESLCLMLGQADCETRLNAIELVVVDEWHELMGNKRGVQVQLALARLTKFNPELRVWGLSATLGNLKEAMHVLHGHEHGQLVQGASPKKIVIDTLMPPAFERIPWAGHLGMSMRDAVANELDSTGTALVFCNTRSQAELWYQALLEARPDWAGLIALHHGSLDKEVREWVEAGLKEGRLKVVVCTSSLDLGVDFSPVQRVLQIGSAKGVARLLQRAGRSGHSPGKPSRVTLVPTNALELVESAAAQDAVAARNIESRASPNKPLDVLVQHLVTVALGSGFRALDIFEEIRTTFAYQNITQDEFDWALDFVTRGGQSLTVYEEYRRVVIDDNGVMRVPDAMIAKRHRMSIGTIVSDASIQVKWMTGGRIGVVEESFVGRLKKGDCFLFAGRMLELVRIHEMTAYVRKASGKRSAVPRWNGGKMPLSSEMADAVLLRLECAAQGEFKGAEMQRIKPLLALQNKMSGLPSLKVLLAESLTTKDGNHLFLYPFAGRNVHIGLGALLSWRASQIKSATFSIAVNDYGLEILSPEPVDWQNIAQFLSSEHLLEDVMQSLNSSELALRRFREIARISGLVFQGFPGAPRSNKQLQASAGLFYEVFKKHDSSNLLLTQAQTEVLELELEIGRLRISLDRIAKRSLNFVQIQKPTPFAFPLMVERLRERLSTEKLSDRIARMIAEVEASIKP